MASSNPFVTLEEHFMLPHLAEAMCSKDTMSALHPGVDLLPVMFVKEKLLDLGPLRLQDMDAGTVGLQVLSHAPISLPNEPTTATCHAANEAIADAVHAHPSRFSGFAWLNMREPDKAAAELRQRVAQGFLGAFLDDHTPDGQRYDDPRFWPVFEAAQDLDVPVYLHPSFPPAPSEVGALPPQMATSDVHRGNYHEAVAGMLSCAALSWHSETALHFLRLFAAGLFEKFPRLKLVLGHDGEGLPFFFDRIERNASRWPLKGNVERMRSFRTVWNENIWITTSGMFGLGPMSCMLRSVKPERIMLSVDYPFSSNVQGKELMDELLKNGMVSQEQFEMIGWKNAKSLLKLQ